MAGDVDLIWVNQEGKYFRTQSWTGGITLNSLRKINFPRT
jgi:hypothetical protein